MAVEGPHPESLKAAFSADPQPKIYLIQIAGFSFSNVSSPGLRRNNSPAHETIFRFSCRRPETFADYQLPNESR
jgi:hypothetical protein